MTQKVAFWLNSAEQRPRALKAMRGFSGFKKMNSLYTLGSGDLVVMEDDDAPEYSKGLEGAMRHINSNGCEMCGLEQFEAMCAANKERLNRHQLRGGMSNCKPRELDL